VRVGALLTVAALVLAGTSAAAWALAATGTGKAKAGVLVGNKPTATSGGPISVTLAWAATPGATGYHILRTGGIGSIGGTCTGTVTGTSCSDSPVVPLTTYSYTVTPVAGAWTGTASPATAYTA